MAFSEFNVWAFLLIIAALLVSMLIANALARFVPFLHKSLIPASVMGGIILLIVSTVIFYCTGGVKGGGRYIFNVLSTDATYSGDMNVLEIITYHCLAIGFIAMGMRTNDKKLTKKRTVEVVDSGITTVSGYLVQAAIGIIITVICVQAFKVEGLLDGSGVLLCMGFGQGTGQALNFGSQYQDMGMGGGKNFGLTIAAIGFLVACIVGVVYINILRRKGIVKVVDKDERYTLADYEGENEIPHTASVDKLTVQIAIVITIYAISYLLMWGLTELFKLFNMDISSLLFGFNFLIGVILTIPAKALIKKLEKKGVIKKKIINNFMMSRISGFAFDIMIVAGFAAIRIPLLADHWWVLLLLAVFGGALTFLYVYYVCKILFPGYRHEQFLAMFGMLTGTASTGTILLREIDGTYKTPASENLIYQTLPAMALGAVMLILVPMAGKSLTNALIVLGIVIAYGVVLNLVLFRRKIFKRKRSALPTAEAAAEIAAADGEQTDGAQPGVQEGAPSEMQDAGTQDGQ